MVRGISKSTAKSGITRENRISKGVRSSGFWHVARGNRRERGGRIGQRESSEGKGAAKSLSTRRLPLGASKEFFSA